MAVAYDRNVTRRRRSFDFLILLIMTFVFLFLSEHPISHHECRGALPRADDGNKPFAQASQNA